MLQPFFDVSRPVVNKNGSINKSFVMGYGDPVHIVREVAIAPLKLFGPSGILCSWPFCEDGYRIAYFFGHFENLPSKPELFKFAPPSDLGCDHMAPAFQVRNISI